MSRESIHSVFCLNFTMFEDVNGVIYGGIFAITFHNENMQKHEKIKDANLAGPLLLLADHIFFERNLRTSDSMLLCAFARA